MPLIFHLPFNNSVGYGIGGSNAFVPGPIGAALDLNNSVRLEYKLPFQVNSFHWTLSYWVKYTADTSSNFRRIWHTESAISPHSYVHIGDNREPENTRIIHLIKDQVISSWDSYDMIGNALFSQGGWHHLVTVWDNTGFDNYRDGVYIGRRTFTVDKDELEYFDTFIINNTPPNTTHAADFRIYDHLLTANEVKRLYNKRKIFHAPMNEPVPFVRGLRERWVTHDLVAHPTTRAELDDVFNTDTTDVAIGGEGIWAEEVNFGSGLQTGGDGRTNTKPGYLPADFYAWMVDGFIYAPETGTYTFGIDGDDACDIVVNEQLTAHWYGGHGFSGSWDEGTGGEGQNTGTISLVAGNYYPFIARFCERTGGDGIQIGWQKPSDSSITRIPTEVLFMYPNPQDIARHGNSLVPAHYIPQLQEDGTFEVSDGQYFVSSKPVALYDSYDGFTVCYWVKFNSIGTDWQYAIHMNEGSVNVGVSAFYGGITNTTEGSKLTLTIGAPDVPDTFRAGITDIDPNTNQWYFMAATWDKQTVKVYVDMVEKVDYVLTSITNQSSLMRIGGHVSSGNKYRPMDGIVKDVRLYAKALSVDELTSIYEQKEKVSITNYGAIIAPKFQQKINLEHGLVGHWKLDGNTNDSSLYGNNGTSTNAVSGTRGYDFSGTTRSYITIPHRKILDNRREITFSFWFKLNSMPATWTCLFSKMDDASTASTRTFSLFINSSGYAHLSAANEGFNSVSSNSPTGGITTDIWYHYVGVIDYNTGWFKGYIDGYKSNQGAVKIIDSTSNTESLSIGDRTSVHNMTNGSISNVRLYNRILNDTEIKALYNLEYV